MNLSKKDIELLKKWGYDDEDIPQIEKAVGCTKYELHIEGKDKLIKKSVSRSEARELLGDELFLSGIARSAFHWSAVREFKAYHLIYFDSSKLFR